MPRVAAILSRWCTLVLALACIVSSAPLIAQETISYTYDALGRLVKVDHGLTGPNANLVASYSYDPADNRCSVNVSTTGAGGTGTCASSGGTTALTLSPTTLTAGTVATAYNMTISAAGGSGSGYAFASTAGTLPTGLSLSAAGLLSGTPGTAAIYRFTVTATDTAGNTGSQSYTVTVSPANDLTLSPSTLPGGTVSTSYSRTITATGGTSPYTFTKSTGTLPAGLTLSSGGVLSGTPTTAATYSFTVQATDSTGNHIGTKSYSVTIAAGGPVANPDSANTTVCGTVSVNVIANDTGTPPLTLTGIVSSTKGTASVESSTNVSYTAFGNAGTGVVTYTVTDGHGATANGTLSVGISGGVCP